MTTVLKKSVGVLFLISMACLAGCYQMHSDDDLRTVPVTNNPNIVPRNGSPIPGAAI